MSSQSTQINWREPDTFCAGDTMLFQRYLRDYTPQNGWSLSYEIRGGGQPIVFVSAALGDYHAVEVDPAVTLLWVPSQCVLVGFAVNVTGERHQIYYHELQIFTNEGAQQNIAPQTTHSQRMITLLEGQLEKLAAHAIDESNIEQTQIARVKRLDLERQLAINIHKRMNEIEMENVRNGRPSGTKIISQMNIINSGSSRAVNQTGNLVP